MQSTVGGTVVGVSYSANACRQLPCQLRQKGRHIAARLDIEHAAVKATTWAKNLRVHKSGNLYTIEIKNPVEYASYVEFGHRTVSGGWVDGKYMLTISEERLKQIAPSVLEKMLYQKIREVIEHG